MIISARVRGLGDAMARLAVIGRRIDPVLRGTLNTTASKARTERFAKPMAAVFGSRAKASKKIVLKRAGRNRAEARLIPSSSGVPIPEFKGWGFETISKTRARIIINGLGGRKVAAGFVNPASAGKNPLRTRSSVTRQLSGGKIRTYDYKSGLAGALGPSAAYFFKKLSTRETLQWINSAMAHELERRIRKAESQASA